MITPPVSTISSSITPAQNTEEISDESSNSEVQEIVIQDEFATIIDPQIKQQLITEIEETIYQIEKQIEEKKLNNKVQITNLESQLSELEYSLQIARKDYEKAYNTFNKLTIRAPIAGNIKDIFVQEGENIREGNQLFSIIPTNQTNQIEIALTFEEYLSTLTIEEITIKTDSRTFTGNIAIRSPVANEDGMYMLTIESSDEITNTQSEFEIQFPIKTDFFYLPKQVIEIKNQNE